MSEFVLKWYIRLFDLLSLEYKAELIARLADRLKDSFNDPESSDEEKRRRIALEELILAWKDTDLDGDFIVESRTVSSKIYDL